MRFVLMFSPKDKKRFEKIRSFTPIDAVLAWLEGDFGIGDETALIEAIRKDKRISISDEAITDVILDAMDEGLDAAACMERLTASN
ncbi:MAG TPA: hypothetical protein VFB72_16605 [Verrucomicrobiae bacterium]|nr:hypothetical protein [Verrucomicrobiae bacterium]